MKIFKFILIFIGLFVFYSCENMNKTADIKIQSGGTAVVGILGDIADLFPYTINDYFGQEISSTLLNPALTRLTDDGEVFPQLASAWSASNDNLSITYIINKKYKWNTGEPVSAYDITETYNFVKQNISEFNNPLNYDFIKSVTVLDSLTVKFNFISPVSDPLRRTRFAVMNSRQIKNNSSFENIINDFTNNFIGCGPYLLEKNDGKNIVLQANKFYFGPGPYLEKIVFRMYSGMDSISAALKKNEIDIVPSLPMRLFDKDKEFADYHDEKGLEKGFEFLGWNMRHSILKNLEIRKALTYAIDIPTIVDGVLGDNAQIEDRPVLSYNPTEKNELDLSYDPKKAAELLAGQGWEKKINNKYLTKNSKLFHIKIITNEENDIRHELAVNIRGYYEALHIKVSLEFLPWNELVQRLENGNFDAVIISWQENSPLDEMQMYHSRSIESGKNFLAYSNARADQLIELALHTDNKNIRSQTLEQLQEVIKADQPLTVLCRQKMVHITSNKLNNVSINKQSIFFSAPVWYRQDNLKQE